MVLAYGLVRYRIGFSRHAHGPTGVHMKLPRKYANTLVLTHPLSYGWTLALQYLKCLPPVPAGVVMWALRLRRTKARDSSSTGTNLSIYSIRLYSTLIRHPGFHISRPHSRTHTGTRGRAQGRAIPAIPATTAVTATTATTAIPAVTATTATTAVTAIPAIPATPAVTAVPAIPASTAGARGRAAGIGYLKLRRKLRRVP